MKHGIKMASLLLLYLYHSRRIINVIQLVFEGINYSYTNMFRSIVPVSCNPISFKRRIAHENSTIEALNMYALYLWYGNDEINEMHDYFRFLFLLLFYWPLWTQNIKSILHGICVSKRNLLSVSKADTANNKILTSYGKSFFINGE